VTERIFAVLYVSIIGLTRCYKTTFLRVTHTQHKYMMFVCHSTYDDRCSLL